MARGPALGVDWPLRLTLFAMVATSGVVMLEPAPCDVLFVPVIGLAVLGGYPLLVGKLDPILHGGLVLFIAANLWTVTWSEDIKLAFKFAAVTVYLLLMWMVLASIISIHGMRAIRVLVFGFLVAAGGAAFVAILARYHVMPNSEQFYLTEHGFRIKSTFKDPNVFGPFMATGIVLLIANILHEGRRWLLSMSLLLALTCGLLLAFSRGAYISLGVSLAVMFVAEVFIVRDEQVLKRMVLLAVPTVTMGAALVTLVLATSGMGDFLGERMSLQGYDDHRFSNQFNVLLTAGDTPLGIGPGQWEFPRYAFAVHNLYLRVLVETGWMGLIGFLAFVGGVMTTALTGIVRRSPFVGVHVASLAIMAGTFFESIVIDTLHWRHLFFAMSLSTGLDAYERTFRASRSPS